MTNKLRIEHINKKFVDEIEFVYTSCPGCLGSDGDIEFILKDSNRYVCNMSYEELDNYLDYELLKTELKKYGFNLKMDSHIDGYEFVYLGGYGNFLFMKEKYALEFYRLVYGLIPVEVYKKRNELIDYLLCTQSSTI